MRLTTVVLTLLVAAVAACSDSGVPTAESEPLFAGGSTTAGGDVPTGRHIIQFGPQPASDFARQVEALGGRVEWTGAGLATVSGLDVDGRRRLSGRKDVRLILDDVAFALDLPQGSRGEAELPGSAPASPSQPNTSFFFARQWHLRAVGADQAWAAGFRGSSAVKVFVLDTGIDETHVDLAGRVDLSLSKDLLGTILVDDGGVQVPFNEAALIQQLFPGRAATSDLFYHGTHVAATISSNALAAAGMASQTKLVAVKVCSVLNICPFSSVLNGIIYAADNNADVVNLSLGGGFAKAGRGQLVGIIDQVFNYARSRGTTIVVAAGNDTTDLDHDRNTFSTYCDAPGVICVSATGPTNQAAINGPWTSQDAPATYTNFGRSVIAVAAPGGNLNASPAASTFVHAACSSTSLIIPVCQTAKSFVVGSSGTSMAAPHVAGAAAMLVPQLGRSPAAIHARLQKSADDLGQSGTDAYYGKGRLNIARALGVIP
ncbi:MAG TPA: S8 family serine peptidase [Gemmatimonadales bacterium]|nr:S8 family serine peptidase [Gemmatimonadales bacterium]